MEIYRKFLKHLLRNYFVGSTIAVLGVGSIFIFTTLQLSPAECVYVSVILIISLLVMFGAEFLAFSRHIRPIRVLYRQRRPSPETLRKGYLQTHKFPMFATQRILGPHLFGLALPAISLVIYSIRSGLIAIPYYYVGLAAIGMLLVAGMHALIEFFLTNHAIRPVLIHIRQQSIALYESDLTLDGQVLVSIQRKFQWSAFLIGTFPLFLFSLATQIRLGEMALQQSTQYWKWAGIILMIGTMFSSLGAWLLSRDIVHPIRNLFASINEVRNGNFDVKAEDIYADEFSKLVSGFNHMVEGLKTRENRNNQLVQSYFTTLAAALDARDPYTAGHSLRVADYSLRIGRLACLSKAELSVLEKAALLHDIGKIGIRDAVLLKEGRLTDEEFAAIKLHPVLGENILRQIEPADALADILPGVRSHHEHYNGTGYPDGLAGKRIPLLGRIIAIADAFDAMTSDRPYRKGMPVAKALSILEEGSGVQWDPDLTPLFVRAMREEHLQAQQERERDAQAHIAATCNI
ncbi:HD domain-containing phosphohydrolase [Effusibacillus pohliae]|uniref:HD domain-containing phosphohydrolase n=1 Tax=Effusibacillus pohliae TaxID=232270 RepID=UPI00037CE23E|nr:HD domain-containing phosphohydrolase [Effusibacillus pohliae]